MIGQQQSIDNVHFKDNIFFPKIKTNRREPITTFPQPTLVLLKCTSDVFPKNTEENLNQSMLGSVHQYMTPDLKREPFWILSKNRCQYEERRRYDIGEAERILLDNNKQKEERIAASKFIAQTMFKNIFGEKLKKIEQDQRQKQNIRIKNLININSLEVVMNEMEYNPRSQSIMLRKQQLDKLREFGRQQKSKKVIGKFNAKEASKIEIIYRLKNQYSSLKGIIIPTRSQQYEYFASFYNQKDQNNPDIDRSMTGNSFFKTILPNNKLNKAFDEAPNKQGEYFEKFKAYKNSSSVIKHCPSRFVRTDETLVLENIMEMKAPAFMYLLNECKFERLKFIKLKYIRIGQDLLLLFLDCLRQMAAGIGFIQVLELSSITIQNRSRFSEKLSLLLRQVNVKSLKLESMDLCTSEFNRISSGLLENKDIEQISLRHNRIDILGVRNMQMLSKSLSKLRRLDVRNNDIPHYANLKDKNPLIFFF